MREGEAEATVAGAAEVMAAGAAEEKVAETEEAAEDQCSVWGIW